MRIHLYPNTPRYGSQRRRNLRHRNLRHRSHQHQYRRCGRLLLLLCLCGLFWSMSNVVVAQAAPVSQVPQPRDDRVFLDEDTTVTIDVLANDTESAGNPLTIGEVGGFRDGTAEIVDNKILYTPNPNHYGLDSFFYTVHNGDLTKTRQANVRLEITRDDGDPPSEVLLRSNSTNNAPPPEPLTENKAVGSSVGTIMARDPDLTCNVFGLRTDCRTFLKRGFLFTLAGTDNDNRFFEITGGGLGAANLILAESLVGQGKSSYTIGVQVRDPEGLTFTQNVVLQGTDANDPPTAITLDNDRVNENAVTSFGVLSTVDEDDTGILDHKYTLVEGSGSDDNSLFEIPTGLRELRTVVALDFEEKPVRSIRIRTTDPNGGFFEQIFLIQVNNLFDPTPTSLPTSTFTPSPTFTPPPTPLPDTPTPGPTPTSTFTPSPTPSPTPEVFNRLSYCSGDTITLIDNGRSSSKKVLVEINEISIDDLERTSCTVEGKMTITTNGETERNIDFEGEVNSRNQFRESEIEDFEISLAGVTLRARDVEVEYVSERPSLHITKPRLKMPRDFGGLEARISVPTFVDNGGIKFGTGDIKLPSITTKSGFALELTGALRSVNDGFEIKADGDLTIPNIKKGKKSRNRTCTIGAGVTISVNAQGQTVMAIAAGKALLDTSSVASSGANGGPTVANAQQTSFMGTEASSPDAIDRFRLSAIRARASCDPGLPIGSTGLFLTSVSGEVTLVPGGEKVDVEVAIEAGKSIKGIGPIVSVDGEMGFQPRPFKLDLGGTIKVLVFEMARADATIVKRGFKVRIKTSDFFGFIPYTTDVKITAFKGDKGKATFAGSGRVAIEMKKGSLGEECFIGICAPLPPFNIPTLASARVEAGEFRFKKVKSFSPPEIGTFRTTGFKGVASILGIGSRGFFVRSSGKLEFRDVDTFKLVEPPFIAAARTAIAEARKAAQASGTVNAASINKDTTRGVTFLDDIEGRPSSVILDVPLTKPMVDVNQVQAAGVTDVISQVNLIQHGDVLFRLTAAEPLELTLITPGGDEVTPANYTETVGYNIDYSQVVVWGEEKEPEVTDGIDLVEPLTDEAGEGEIQDTSATLLFTAVSSDPTITGLDLKIDGTVVYYDIDAQDTVWLEPLPLTPGEHSVELLTHGTTDVVLDTTIDLITKTNYSLISYGGANSGLAILEDENEAPETMGKAKVRMVNVATPSLNMVVNGAPLLTDQERLSKSDFALVDAGATTIEFRNSTSDAQVSETLSVALADGGVYTFFATDDVNDVVPGFDVSILQRTDAMYMPIYMTTYSVDQAMMNESWQTKLVGDTDNVPFQLTVEGLDSPPILGSVTVDASDGNTAQVSWQLTTDINPTTVQVYANPEDITFTSTLTNADGSVNSQEIPLYEGDLLAEFEITDVAELGGQLVTKAVDISGLESGTYHFWVRAYDGLNPPVTSYADAPSAMAAGVQSIYGTNAVWLAKDDYNMMQEVNDAFPVVIDRSTTFPLDWTATITPTFDATANALDVEWAISSHPDVDTYHLLFGSTPLSPTQVITVGGALAVLDENDEDTGIQIGFERLTNIAPDTPYFISIEAIDSESGQSVRSQEVEFSVASADFTLTTLQTSTPVEAGKQVTIPVTLSADEALFFPNVWLAANLGNTPPGVTARFANDVEGFPGIDQGQPTRLLEVSVDASVPAGTYPIIITGYNGEKDRDLALDLVVSASADAPNTAPTANETLVDVPGATKPVVLGGSDVDSDSLTFTIVTQPANGELTGTAPNLTYTPNPGFSGTDSFTYTVNDGTVDSLPATVMIRVEPGPPEINSGDIFLPYIAQ